jgi:hypothetical protein
VAATWGKLEISQKVCDSVKEELTTEEMYNKMLLGIDSEGRTVLNLAAKWGQLEELQKLWD